MSTDTQPIETKVERCTGDLPDMRPPLRRRNPHGFWKNHLCALADGECDYLKIDGGSSSEYAFNMRTSVGSIARGLGIKIKIQYIRGDDYIVTLRKGGVQ